MKRAEDVEGLKKLMDEHIAHRHGSETVRLLWSGYLAALLLRGHIDQNTHNYMSGSLQDAGTDIVHDILANEDLGHG